MALLLSRVWAVKGGGALRTMTLRELAEADIAEDLLTGGLLDSLEAALGPTTLTILLFVWVGVALKSLYLRLKKGSSWNSCIYGKSGRG